MVHHLPTSRPRAARESVQNTVAREVMVWFITSTPEGHAFPNQLAPGDMALSQEGDIWLWNGLVWSLLVASRTDDELRVKNLRVQESTRGLEIEYEDGV